MKFFRYLLNYTFLLALLIAVVVGYNYRSELYPELQRGVDLLGSEIQNGLEVLDEKASELAQSAEDSADPGIGEVNEVSLPESIEAEPVAEADQPPLVLDQSAVPVGEARVPEVELSPSVHQSAEQVSPVLVVATPEVEIEAELAPIGSESESVVEEVSATVLAETPQVVLEQARRAYWNGNFALAESSYRELIEQQLINPNYSGELGNLLYTQGRYDEAATHYYEAGSQLVELGHIGQAIYLTRILYGLSPEWAAELERKVEQKIKQQ